MPPKFIFVRHGEAKHNVLFHEVGEGAFENEEVRDAPLTALGIKQAVETAKNLSSLNIVDIWCSPLTRCIQTAEELFEETSAQNFYLHDNLLERLGGNHVCNERKSKKELKEKHGFLITTFLPEYSAKWVEREDWTALHYRMRAMVIMLADIYKSLPETSHILVVSHKDAIFSITKKELDKAGYIILTLEELLEKNQKIE